MNLSFLHGGIALLGVGATSIPIIIHLLLRQKPRPIDFPALQLLRKRQTRSVRRLRLRQLLLLALRMALLLLLALALARPTLRTSLLAIDQEAPVAVMLVFDTSLSMQFKHHGKNRLEVSREQAEAVVRELPDRSEIMIIESTKPATNVPFDVPGAISRLQTIELQATPRPLNDAVGLAYKGLAKSQLQRREVYIFTDMAVGAWNAEDGRGLEQLAALAEPGLRVYVIDVGANEPGSLALGDVELSKQVITAGGQVAVTVSIQNTGPTVDGTIELSVDGQPRDNKAVRLPAEKATEVAFSIPGLAEGLHQGRIELRSPDPMPFDDVRYFTVVVRPPIRTLVVFDRAEDTLHWTKALVPDQFRKMQQARYEIEAIESTRLESTDLSPFQVVSLLNVGSLSEDAWMKLSGFVQEGGGLFVALGDLVDPVSYGSDAAQTVLAGRLTEEVRRPDGEFFAPENFSHPLLGKFREWENSDMAILPVLRYWMAERAQGSTVVIPLTGGSPGLLERSFGQGKRGRSLLWTTAAHHRSSNSWTELPLGWSYLVLVHEMMQYLAGAADHQANFLAGARVTIPLDPNDPYVQFSITDPEGRTDRLAVDLRDTVLSVPTAKRLGNYQVDATEDGRIFAAGFSVNEPLAESVLTPIESGTLEKLIGKDRLTVAGDPDELDTAVDEGRVGRELFPWIMLLVVALICAEGYFANRFYRKPAAAAVAD